MKKLLTILTAFILCFCILTGCGEVDEDSSDNNANITSSDQTDPDSEDSKDSDSESSENSKDSNSKNSGNSKKAKKAKKEDPIGISELADGELLSGTHHVEIDIKDYGKISVELDADTAPITVTNFLKLVQSGFYDDLTFHRIISGFMIQGGDPLGNGTGGSEETIIGEFSSNNIENSISHTRGTISMARSMDMNSASSQFFIMHQDGEYLDGDYAAFGHVTSGIEVVDDICDSVPVQDSNGTVAKKDQPVITSIDIID